MTGLRRWLSPPQCPFYCSISKCDEDPHGPQFDSIKWCCACRRGCCLCRRLFPSHYLVCWCQPIARSLAVLPKKISQLQNLQLSSPQKIFPQAKWTKIHLGVAAQSEEQSRVKSSVRTGQCQQPELPTARSVLLLLQSGQLVTPT